MKRWILLLVVTTSVATGQIIDLNDEAFATSPHPPGIDPEEDTVTASISPHCDPKCAEDEICLLEVVFCKKAPCPQRSRCSSVKTSTPPVKSTSSRCGVNEEHFDCKPCDRSCSQTAGICSLNCVPGCECSEGFVRNQKGECVSDKMCKRIECLDGELWYSCKPCEKKCGSEEPCSEMCEPGCACDGDRLRDFNGKCVEKKDCSVKETKRQISLSLNESTGHEERLFNQDEESIGNGTEISSAHIQRNQNNNSLPVNVTGRPTNSPRTIPLSKLPTQSNVILIRGNEREISKPNATRRPQDLRIPNSTIVNIVNADGVKANTPTTPRPHRPTIVITERTTSKPTTVQRFGSRISTSPTTSRPSTTRRPVVFQVAQNRSRTFANRRPQFPTQFRNVPLRNRTNFRVQNTSPIQSPFCPANEQWFRCQPCDMCTDIMKKVAFQEESCTKLCVSGCGCVTGFRRGSRGCIPNEQCMELMGFRRRNAHGLPVAHRNPPNPPVRGRNRTALPIAHRPTNIRRTQQTNNGTRNGSSPFQRRTDHHSTPLFRNITPSVVVKTPFRTSSLRNQPVHHSIPPASPHTKPTLPPAVLQRNPFRIFRGNATGQRPLVAKPVFRKRPIVDHHVNTTPSNNNHTSPNIRPHVAVVERKNPLPLPLLQGRRVEPIQNRTIQQPHQAERTTNEQLAGNSTQRTSNRLPGASLRPTTDKVLGNTPLTLVKASQIQNENRNSVVEAPANTMANRTNSNVVALNRLQKLPSRQRIEKNQTLSTENGKIDNSIVETENEIKQPTPQSSLVSTTSTDRNLTTSTTMSPSTTPITISTRPNNIKLEREVDVKEVEVNATTAASAAEIRSGTSMKVDNSSLIIEKGIVEKTEVNSPVDSEQSDETGANERKEVTDVEQLDLDKNKFASAPEGP